MDHYTYAHNILANVKLYELSHLLKNFLRMILKTTKSPRNSLQTYLALEYDFCFVSETKQLSILDLRIEAHDSSKRCPNGIRPYHVGCRRHSNPAVDTIGTAPSSNPSSLRDANTGRLHDGLSLSTDTVCGFSYLFAGEPTAFTGHFFLIIGKTNFIYWEPHKLTDSHYRTGQFVTRTAFTGTTTGATAPAIVPAVGATTSTIIQFLLGRRNSSGGTVRPTPLTVDPNLTYSGRIRVPHPRSQPLAYLPPVMPTPISQPNNIDQSKFGAPTVPSLQP